MSEGCPNLESAYAAEGTLGHTVASDILEKYFFSKKLTDRGVLPPDMLPAVKVYVDFIKAEAIVSGADVKAGHILIEHRFDLKDVYPGLFGTADAVIYFPEKKKLLVADYKHGAGIAVEVDDNLQLQYYALGALLSTGFPCNEVEIAVIQPRCEHEKGPIRRYAFPSVDLLDFAADLAFDAAATANPNAPLKPGKHCRFCPAAPTKCPAVKEKALALAKQEFGPAVSYDPAKLAEALAAIPAVEAWITKVREFAYAEAMHGRNPPGWKMVAKRATRKWMADDETIVEFMAEATKREVSEFFEEPSLKSPAQMEKLCSKQIGEGLRKFMESVSSGYNLVPEADKRPAAKLDAKSEFTAIEGAE